jgi:hypothetical protein
MAGILALRAGIQDARQGRQGYMWVMLTRPRGPFNRLARLFLPAAQAPPVEPVYNK